jgi:hypothetical protein
VRQSQEPYVKIVLNTWKMRRQLERSYRSLTSPLRVLPDFLIIGASRSGTTSLFQALIGHPCVVPPFRKEPSFFNHHYDRGTTWYRSQFPLDTHKRFQTSILKRKFRTGEATANYFYYPSVAGKVAKLLPQIRLVLLLRNPVDRAYSDYLLSVRAQRETRSFEEAIREELRGPMSATPENERSLLWVNYLVKGKYADHLAVWLMHFRRDQLLIIKSEGFFRDPSTAFKRVLDHLGLPHWEPGEYASFKEPGRTSYGGKYEGGKYPALPPETRKTLTDFYMPHNERLYTDMQIRFDW